MTHRKQLMIGMHDTGKSTFIGALYHVVESGQVEDSLQLVNLGDNRAYLVEKRDEWLGCREIDRTKLGEEQVLTLTVRDVHTDQITELVLPDVSGETFRDQWEERRSTEVFDDLARQADAVLLFIHPDTVKEPVRINKNKEVAVILEEDDGNAAQPAGQSQEAQNIAQVKWHPKFAPTQVQLIEVLQFLLREPQVYPLSRLAVIVSAWDLVKDDYDSPTAWLLKRLPMLYQFLKANSDRVSFKVFGVSAQGGQLGKDDAEMLGKIRQAERIEVVTDVAGEYDKHDITAPIKWLMTTAE
jgi:hypothetical protein